MRAISLFSGAGGFELGFERAGIDTVLQVEIDPVCLSVLERHWPKTERVGDVRQVDAATLQGRGRDVARAGRGADTERLRHAAGRGSGTEPVDLVYGGFPCQDVSVAGQRAGLRGERSGLWHEFHRVLSELRPRWVVVENVPGLLSSGVEPGADFGVVLRGLVDLGYGVAWRVLDARWFGVPQRRRRVFVVGCLGDAPRAAQVLAVCESCGGDPETSSEAGQDVAPTLDDGARRASVELPLIAAEAVHGRGDRSDVRDGLAATLSGGSHEPGVNLPGRHKEDDENLVVADPLTVTEGKTYTHEGTNNFRTHNLIVGSQRDAGQARPLVARGSGYRMDLESETFVVASTLNGGEVDDQAAPLVGGDGPHGRSTFNGMDTMVAPSMTGVRRLTPLECERLMGWPDEHTRYAADSREIPDSHRYRLCGNGVVATVAEWIGHRLTRANCGPD